MQGALNAHQQVGQRTAGVLDRLASGSTAARPSDDPITWGSVARLERSAARLHSYSDNMSRAAMSAGVALNSMQASGQQLQEMEVSLDRALGSPVGSDARRVALEQFNVLHALADDYSKPDDLNARKLLDDPARFDSAGPLEVAAGEQGFQIRLGNQPIHLGAEGLDLPTAGAALPSDPSAGAVIADISNASDDEIRALGNLLGRARERLNERQSALSGDVSAVERELGQNQSARAMRNSVADGLDSADLEAEAVLAQSLSMRSNLALNGLLGLNETRQLALRLLQ